MQSIIVEEYTYRDSCFVHLGGKWEEWQGQENNLAWTFEESSRDADWIHLFDESRDIWIRLPIQGGMSHIASGSGHMTPIEWAEFKPVEYKTHSYELDVRNAQRQNKTYNQILQYEDRDGWPEDTGSEEYVTRIALFQDKHNLKIDGIMGHNTWRERGHDVRVNTDAERRAWERNKRREIEEARRQHQEGLALTRSRLEDPGITEDERYLLLSNEQEYVKALKDLDKEEERAFGPQT